MNLEFGQAVVLQFLNLIPGLLEVNFHQSKLLNITVNKKKNTKKNIQKNKNVFGCFLVFMSFFFGELFLSLQFFKKNNKNKTKNAIVVLVASFMPNHCIQMDTIWKELALTTDLIDDCGSFKFSAIASKSYR